MTTRSANSPLGEVDTPKRFGRRHEPGRSALLESRPLAVTSALVTTREATVHRVELSEPASAGQRAKKSRKVWS